MRKIWKIRGMGRNNQYLKMWVTGPEHFSAEDVCRDLSGKDIVVTSIQLIADSQDDLYDE